MNSEPPDPLPFEYVFRLGAAETAPTFEIDHDEDLTVGRLVTVTLGGRLVIPFADETELVLSPGSEVTALVVEKVTPTGDDGEDVNEAAFRSVGAMTTER